MSVASVSFRQRVERIVVSKIISEAKAAGYTLSVHDGQELVVKHSTSRKDILAAMFSVDEEHLIINKDGKRLGWIFLVYGNSGWDVICDHSTNLEELLKPVQALADKYS